MTRPRRLAGCAAAWPDADDGYFDPRCCRFPKSCSPYPYPEQVAAGTAVLEPAPTLLVLPPRELNPVDVELDGVPGAEAPRLELANIRRLVERHGIAPADGNGVIRSTVTMVEELALRRPPR